MALTSIYFGGSTNKTFFTWLSFSEQQVVIHTPHSGQRCHFHIHHHKINVSCLFLPIDHFFDFICDKTV